MSWYDKDKDGKFGPWHYIEFTPMPGKTDKAYDWWSTSAATDEAVYAISQSGELTRLDVTSIGAVKAKEEVVVETLGKFK